MGILCDICKSEKVTFHHRHFAFPIIACRKCGYVRARNIPLQKEINTFYSRYNSESDSGIDAITSKRYNVLLNYLESFRKTNNILDYGCGRGHFLKKAKERGWNVMGIEISETAFIHLNKNNIPYIEKDIPVDLHNTFDAAFCIEVIEHVLRPDIAIQEIAVLLRPGGCLYLTTPNIRSLSLSYLKNKSYFISYPEHLNYFTVKSIKTMLNVGFSISKIRTTGITPFKKTDPLNNEININDIENCRTLVEKKTLFLFFKWSVNFILNLLKKGDTIKVFAVKRERLRS